MAGQTADLLHHFGYIGWVGNVGNGMSLNRVALAIAQRQDNNFVFLEVVIGQRDPGVKNLEHSCSFVGLRSGVRSMAFEAKLVAVGAQKFLAIASVGLMARCAALRESGLVMHRLFAQIRDIRVASEANIYAIRFRQAGESTGVRIVAIGAIACGARMLNFCTLNLLGFFVVTRNTHGLRIGLG